VDGLQGATAVAIPTDGRQVYVTGKYDHSLAVFQRDPSNGNLEFTQVLRDDRDGIEGLGESVALAISPDDQFVYVASRGDCALTVFRRNSKNGRLTFVEAVKHGEFLSSWQVDSVAVGPSGRYVFTTSLDANILSVFRRHSADKPLELVAAAVNGLGGVHGLKHPECVSISPEGRDIYVAGHDEGSLTRFRWEEETEQLSFVGCIHNNDDHNGRIVHGLGRVYSITVSADGHYVYTMSCGDDAVSVFHRDTGSGDLEFLETLSSRTTPGSGVSNAEFAAISPDGRYLYTAATWDNAIAVFRRESSGSESH
jgi:6-phosphogluconolactonase (cycloisomerase 2 family)